MTKTRKKKMELDIINPKAAGIDVGSRSHYVELNLKVAHRPFYRSYV